MQAVTYYMYIVISLWCVRCEYPGGVLPEILLEDLRQLQQWFPRRERGTLNQTLLVEDKDVSRTGQHHSAALRPGPWETSGSEVRGERV